jgi:ATP-dependent RNA helicase HelY
MAQRGHYRRSGRTQPRRTKKEDAGGPDYANPRIDPGLRSFFGQIGVPEPEPFIPDPFQLEALDRIKDRDVLVCAPTGAGKTWVASQTIHSFINKDLRVWYASPLKALSNSIYLQFCHEFGPQSCGIVTGDRKENTDAPIIVGTTEILRNQLYDVMHQGASIRTDLVILDEAHYLSDPDRGVVWEEVLIYLPPRVKLLLLSATISNADEVCEWLNHIRGVPNTVVRAEGRPVPLKMLFLMPDGLMMPLGDKRGLDPKVKKFLSGSTQKQSGQTDRIDYGQVIECMRALDLLPAIFFLKSRSECDRALYTCHILKNFKYQEGLESFIEAFCDDYPHLRAHRQIRSLVECKVSSHHGGQLPYWKVLVENLMSQGYLDAIFSTSTVAAGVNFPARTVVLVQSDRFNGHDFAPLSATEFHQMVGRAGRRGKDNIGFSVVIPGRYQNPELIHAISESQPEPILSQIRINFSMTLNLLLSHTPSEIQHLIEQSFASFQEGEAEAALKKRMNELGLELQKILPKSKCSGSDPVEIAELIDMRRELKKGLRKARHSFRTKKTAERWKQNLEPGRLFLHKNGNIYVAVKTLLDQGRPVCMAQQARQPEPNRTRQERLRKIDLNQIEAVLNCRIDIHPDVAGEGLNRLLAAINLEQMAQLRMDIDDDETGIEQDLGSDIEGIETRVKSMLCELCAHLNVCHGGGKTPLFKKLREFQTVVARMSGSGGGLWFSFRQHLRFLKETNFVDTDHRLTRDGYWASKLRLDQPLLIADAIRKGAFDGISPELLAGGLAPFVWDRTQEVDMKMKWRLELEELEHVFSRTLESIEEIRKLKKKRGFATPAILFWPAVALHLWATGTPWEQLMACLDVDEGDLASLIMRTADHLRQVANLEETHPQLAAVAKAAVELILREPVFID